MLLFNNLCTGYGMRMWLSLVLARHVKGMGISTYSHLLWTLMTSIKTGWLSKDKENKLSFTHPTTHPHS